MQFSAPKEFLCVDMLLPAGIRLRTPLTVLGNYINVPVAYLPQHASSSAAVGTCCGVPYVVPASLSPCAFRNG